MTSSPSTVRRSKVVLLGLTASAASALAGCASEPDVAAICTDPQTQQRVDDDQCDDSDDPEDYHGTGSGFFWYYLGTQSGRVPAVGSRYNAGSGSYDGSKYVSAGKSVQRGGLPNEGVSSFKSFSKSGGFGSSRGVSSS